MRTFTAGVVFGAALVTLTHTAHRKLSVRGGLVEVYGDPDTIRDAFPDHTRAMWDALDDIAAANGQTAARN